MGDVTPAGRPFLRAVRAQKKVVPLAFYFVILDLSDKTFKHHQLTFVQEGYLFVWLLSGGYLRCARYGTCPGRHLKGTPLTDLFELILLYNVI